MRIRWLRRALGSLEEITDYIAVDTPAAAGRIEQRIVSAVNQTSSQPEMGRIGRVQGTRELVISGTSYIVAYRVKGKTIEILRVLHAARKWPENF